MSLNLNRLYSHSATGWKLCFCPGSLSSTVGTVSGVFSIPRFGIIGTEGVVRGVSGTDGDTTWGTLEGMSGKGRSAIRFYI